MFRPSKRYRSTVMTAERSSRTRQALIAAVLALFTTTTAPRPVLSAEVVESQPEVKPPADNALLDSAIRLLKDHGVEPNTKSLQAYLRSMLPDSESQKTQAKLIRQLGDDDYHKREAAMKILLRLPVVSAELLKTAAESEDPEVRWRASRILKTATRRSSELLLASYRVISTRGVPGLAAEVLATMPLCSDLYERRAAMRALVATATPVDGPLLQKRLDDESPSVRIAAIRAYARVLGKEADQQLARLAVDKDDRIKLEALRGMLSHANRDALPPLVKLLGSEELSVRVGSARLLRAVSGKRFGFVAYEDAKNRKTAVLKWRDWIASNAQTVDLSKPLRIRRELLGRTLVCDYQRNRVIELDANGNAVWERPVGRHPWGCQGLPNGHRLIACYSTRTVTEYDAKGSVHWAKSSLPGGPTSVERLDNGNTLIACTDSGKVVEVNRKNEIVWEVTISQRPTDAHRLENGRTLITLQNGGRVVEVDRKGNVVWQISGITSPFSAYRLDNGNTLVASVGRGMVLEYDRGGKVVWSQTGLSNPYDAQRLSNGNTLISDSSGVREVDRAGKTIWMHSQSGVSKIHRY